MILLKTTFIPASSSFPLGTICSVGRSNPNETKPGLSSVVKEYRVPKSPLYQSSEAPPTGSKELQNCSKNLPLQSEKDLHNSAEFLASNSVPFTLKVASTASSANCLISRQLSGLEELSNP